MSNAHGDWMKDRIASVKRLLKCDEVCKDCTSNDPFECECVIECLFNKCEELDAKWRKAEAEL